MFEIMLGGRGKSKSTLSMFVREVSSAEFITGDQLASQIGFTAGTPLYSDGGWLLFEDIIDGKTKYISKLPLRHSISWDSLHVAGAVFGTATVAIKGLTYKVRLLSGANTNPSTATNSTYDHSGTHGSEWNRLMYHVAKGNGGTDVFASEPNAPGDWAQYTLGQLSLALGNKGSWNLCQETGIDSTQRLFRGYYGLSFTIYRSSSMSAEAFGWRPVLELVE